MMACYSLSDVCWLVAERYGTKSNEKLAGFRSQFEASCVCSHIDELWYNETVCLWMTIYIYIYIYMNNVDKKVFAQKLLDVMSNLKKYENSVLLESVTESLRWRSQSSDGNMRKMANQPYL